LISTNFSYDNFGERLDVLGEKHGYQHVWKEAEGSPNGNEARVGWFSDNKFYELTTYVDSTDKLILARAGANDPNFNIRRDAFFLLRKESQKDALFVSTIRAHGSYSPVSEIPNNPYPDQIHIKVLLDQRDYSIIEIDTENSAPMILLIANASKDPTQEHQVDLGDKKMTWTGPVSLKKTNKK